MVDISLTKSLRSTVAMLNKVSDESAAASQRLTTGIKVQTALDDPSAYISAKNLSLHAAALDKYLERLDQGLGVIKAADNGLTSITDSIDTLKGVVTRAAASKNAFDRADLAKEYNSILDHIVATAKDSSYGGKNLLLGAGNELKLYLSADQDESVTIDAVDFTDLLNTLGLKKLDEGKLATFETKLTDSGGNPLKTTSKLTDSGQYAVGDTIEVKDTAVPPNTVNKLTVTADTTAGDLVTAFSLPDKGLRASLGNDGVLTVEAADSFTIDKTDAGGTTTAIADLKSAIASSWVKRSDAEDARQTVANARQATQKHATNIGIGLTLLKSRADFVGSFSEVLNSTAESLRASNKDEEAATMLALSTQQQLAISSFSITQTADNGILRLLGGGSS
jgi:flagellin-like hook-associated protein FlgL